MLIIYRQFNVSKVQCSHCLAYDDYTVLSYLSCFGRNEV